MLDRVLMSLLSVYVDHQIRDCLGGCMRGSFLPPAGTTGPELREGGRGSCYDCGGIIVQTSMKIPGRIQDNGDPQSYSQAVIHSSLAS